LKSGNSDTEQRRVTVKNFFLTLAIGAMVAFFGQDSALAATLKAHVDLSSQTMTVSKGGRVLHRWKVSSGRKGYGTPTGSYRPTRMHKRYFSRKYDNAPMPYAIFFRGGYAIHGTNAVSRLGRPASHGCIRLHPSNAARLFALVNQSGRSNTRISISW
jgi:lipoprotein-anchoring transpeptidase ErfK/SrfK